MWRLQPFWNVIFYQYTQIKYKNKLFSIVFQCYDSSKLLQEITRNVRFFTIFDKLSLMKWERVYNISCINVNMRGFTTYGPILNRLLFIEHFKNNFWKSLLSDNLLQKCWTPVEKIEFLAPLPPFQCWLQCKNGFFMHIHRKNDSLNQTTLIWGEGGK